MPAALLSETDSPTPKAYAGAAACLECHSDMKDTLAPTLHGRGGFGALSDRGCETCHGPAKAHAENPDGSSLIPAFEKLDAKTQARTCQQSRRRQNWGDPRTAFTRSVPDR
jgi:hypothetical protein